ncbi:MAG: type II secretion system F family protein [Phycisphaerales bacterium]
MGTYSYIARDTNGARIAGRLSGSTEQVVLAELHARSLSPVRIDEVRESHALPVLGNRGVRTRTLAGFYRQLADLLRAGVPLLRALKLLARGKSQPRLAAVVRIISEQVAEGERLADAMAAAPEVFPSVQVAMVRAGETGGFLEEVLLRLGAFLEHQADMKSKVVGNLIYPIVLLALALAVVVGALVFFVPKFETMFARLELPLPTRLLLGMSNALTQHWLMCVIVTGVLVATLLWMLRQPSVRRRIAELTLRVPGLGPFISSLAVARFARMLGTLLGNGIPMLQSMRISRDAAGHPVLADAVDAAVEAVRAGETLAEPLAASGMIADDVIEMVSVGEAANNLPDVLVTVADTIEKRIDRMLATLLRLMEPLLLLLLAGVVVFIFIALFMPMMQMSSAIGR